MLGRWMCVLSLVLAGQETLSYSSENKPTNNEIASAVHCGGRNRGRSTAIQDSMHSDPAFMHCIVCHLIIEEVLSL